MLNIAPGHHSAETARASPTPNQTKKGDHLTAPNWGPYIQTSYSWGPPCGPSFESQFPQNIKGFFCFCVSVQVTAVYQWWNYLESLCPSEKTILRLNLDETAVKTWMMPGKGLVLKPRQGARRGKRRFALASRKQQRGCLTHVAIVCDRPEMQPLLPQVVIGNHAVLPLYIQKEIEPHLHKHVFLVRRKSAWVDATYMITIMELLGKVLKPFLNKFQPILLMDALPAHIAPTVFCAAAKSGIWVVIVPAKLTWLLQPADTHLFYKYKMYLRKRYLKSMARCEEGALQLRAVLKAINDAVRYVCQAHEWGKAFDGNGFGQRQRHVRRAIVEAGELNFPCVFFLESHP